MKQPIYNTALYLRLSRDDEGAGESNSIATQRMMLRSYVFAPPLIYGLSWRLLPHEQLEQRFFLLSILFHHPPADALLAPGR